MDGGVTMDWLMEDVIASGAGLSLAKMSIAIGVTSERHYHTNCTETIHVLQGQIEQRIGTKWISMSAGDTCLIPQDTPHQTRNSGSQTAVMMIAYSAGQRVYVKDE